MANMPSVDRVGRHVAPSRVLDAKVLKAFHDRNTGTYMGAYLAALEWAVRGVTLDDGDYIRIARDRRLALEARNHARRKHGKESRQGQQGQKARQD